MRLWLGSEVALLDTRCDKQKANIVDCLAWMLSMIFGRISGELPRQGDVAPKETRAGRGLCDFSAFEGDGR
jgi:hypothetical protein